MIKSTLWGFAMDDEGKVIRGQLGPGPVLVHKLGLCTGTSYCRVSPLIAHDCSSMHKLTNQAEGQQAVPVRHENDEARNACAETWAMM